MTTPIASSSPHRAGCLLLGPTLLAIALLTALGLVVALVTTLFDLLTTPLLPWFRRHPVDRTAASVDPSSWRSAVIVLTYDGVDHVMALLPTLQVAIDRAPGQHELIVVDNGSQDDTVDRVRREFPGVRLVELPENRYFIRGNAAGVTAALVGERTPDHLVFVNNDMRVEPDFLVELLSGFTGPDVFAVTSRITMDPPVETGLTRAEFRRGALHQLQVPPGNARAIPALWAGGGSSAFDTRLFVALGGFETLYEPCYSEDTSLSYVAWRYGYRVHFRESAVAHHAHRSTSTRVFGRRGVERLSRRNRELFFWRAITSPRMVWSHGLFLGWNAAKDARRFDGLRWPMRLQCEALLWALARLPEALGARPRLRANAKRSDAEVLAFANDVHRYARALGSAPLRPAVLLSIGAAEAPPMTTRSPALTIRHHALPTGLTDGQLRDHLRWLLFEHDYSAVRVRELELMKAVRTLRPQATVLLDIGAALDDEDLLPEARASELADRFRGLDLKPH